MLTTCTFDERPSPHVRVRQWHHRGQRESFACSAHDAYEFALVDSGCIEYRVGERNIELGPSTTIVVPAGTEHVTTPGCEARASSIWLDRAWMEELGGVVGKRLGPDPIVLCATDRVRALLTLLFEEARAPGVGSILAVESLAEVLGLLIYRTDELGSKPSSEPRDRRVLAAMALAENRRSDEIGVDEMARAAGLSRFHFSRLFRDQVGVSPYRFLLRTRLHRAAELLRSGYCGVTEAALSVGFNDLSRFSRAFRAEFGLAPSLFPGSRPASPPRRLASIIPIEPLSLIAGDEGELAVTRREYGLEDRAQGSTGDTALAQVGGASRATRSEPAPRAARG